MKTIKTLGLAATFALLSGNAFAVAIVPSVTTNTGDQKYTTAMTDFSTTGGDMAGMAITVFRGAASETIAWADIAGGTDNDGGAFGTGWSLTLTGDSYTGNNSWILTNTAGAAITKVVLNGVPGQTTFDIVLAPNTVTPDSNVGLVIQDVNGPAGLTVAAEYKDVLAVGASPPGTVFTGPAPSPLAGTVPDEWTVLTLTLGGGGLTSTSPNNVLTFRQDTDNAATAIIPPPPSVPEPMTLALFGAGLVGVAVIRRRRKQK